MKIEDVKITADQKQTPELNEDGTPKIPVSDPALQVDQPPVKVDGDEGDDDQDEDIDDENIDDDQGDEDEDDEELDEDGNPKKKPEDIAPVVTPEVPAVDYKKKFGESTRRNQIVESQFRELQKTLGDITRQEIPSDDEMKAIDPDWEYRSDFEKNLSIKTIVLERRQNHILSTIGNITKESELADQIVEFIDKTPELAGKDAEFYDFVTDPKNKGASLDVLLGAFMHKQGITPKAPDTDPAPVVKKKAPSLARSTPTGGQNQKKQEGTYSDEELTHLRTKDPKKYFDLIRRKKI